MAMVHIMCWKKNIGLRNEKKDVEVDRMIAEYRKMVSLLLAAFMFFACVPLYAADNLEEAGAKVRESVGALQDVRALGDLGYGSNGKFIAPISAPDPKATKIYTAQDLWNVRNNLSGSYVLMNDIDLAFYYGGWEPLGSRGENAFTGVFDGQGYVVSNLGVSTLSSEYYGLFGYVSGGSIANVGLEGSGSILSDIGSYARVGTLCGYADVSSSISNCYNNSRLSVASSSSLPSASVGGICGYSNAPISYCYNTGEINSGSALVAVSAGGICGTSEAEISQCFNTGTVFAGNAGGIAGSTSALVSSCYNTGAVRGEGEALGGICGESSASIRRCFNSGAIALSSDRLSLSVGGICGIYTNYGTGEIVNCFNSGMLMADPISNNISEMNVYVGGICGKLDQPSSLFIVGCYNKGEIYSQSLYMAYAGGIFGYCEDSLTSATSIIDCYNTSDGIHLYAPEMPESTSAFVGGIGGAHISFSPESSMTNCYSNALLSSFASHAYAGAICGSITPSSGSYYQSYAKNCYWSVDSTQIANGARDISNKRGIDALPLIGLDSTRSLGATAMTIQSSYEGFNFATTWCFATGENNGYPVLRSFLPQITGVHIEESMLTKSVGDTISLAAVTLPLDIYPAITWRSSNTNIATVDNQGFVTVKAKGTAVITASASGGFSDSCTIEIYDPNEPYVLVPNVLGRTGREMTFAVSLKNNPGISNYGIVMQYDSSVFEYVSSKVGDIIAEQYSDINNSGLATNQVRFHAATSDGGSIDTDGTLFSVTLKVNGEQAAEVLTQDALLFIYLDDMFDGFTVGSEDFVELFVLQGSVTIKNTFYGDVNGDGRLNGIDQTWMNQFFSGLISPANLLLFDESNADVNGSGVLNGVDQTRMNRFFSGLDPRPFGS